MILRVLTYNLLYGNAFKELTVFIEKYKPDIVCLQEISLDKIESDKKLLSKSYKLAGSCNSFIKKGNIFGLATFYNHKKLFVSYFNNERIPHTIFDWLRFIRNFFKKRVKREFLKTSFKILSSKKNITVFNIHLTAEATNEARIKQIKEVLKSSNKITSPIIIAGDFNYVPYRRKKLENLFSQNGFREASSNIDYTFFVKKNLFLYGPIQKFLAKFLTKIFSDRYKLDFIFYKKLRLIKCERLNSTISDHYPLLAIFKV